MDLSTDFPLAGIRIVDLTHNWAGPHATRIMADFGAEVIKIEYARRMDAMRGAKKEDQAYNHHSRWYQINRNKHSLTLDLKNPADRGVFTDLAATADVVVESSRPGVLPRLGVGYDSLRKLKADIILLSMSAFGQTGPESSFAAYGGSLEPLSGIQGLTAYGPGQRPTRIREVDVTNGVLGACAIMTALWHRQRTGEGQWIDLSQLEAAISGLIGEHMLQYHATGTQALPCGNRHFLYAPQGCYRCKGTDNWITICVRSDREWKALCAVLGHDWLGADPSFCTMEGRANRHDEIDRLIELWTSLYEPTEAMTLLQDAGVPAGAVLDVQGLANNSQLRERGFFIAGPGSRQCCFPGFPFKLSGGRSELRTQGPLLGESNSYVMSELLRRSEAEVIALSEEAIGTAYDVEEDKK